MLYTVLTSCFFTHDVLVYLLLIGLLSYYFVNIKLGGILKC